MMLPFSIIVPVYNCSEHLENCLESILRAGNGDGEIILVDDGSEDRSGEICDRYSSNYDCVSCFHLNHNGVAAARNYGIDKASRDYLLFVDGDDEWSNTFKLAELCQFVSGRDIDLFVYGYCIRNCDGKTLRDTRIHWPLNTINDWREERDSFLTYFPNGWMFPCWNKVFKRTVIQKYGICFHQQQMEDFRFVLEYLDKIESICFLPIEPYLYFKRIGEGSLTKSISLEMVDGCNYCHEYLLYEFGSDHHEAIHQIMVPQYIATVNKCLKSYNKVFSRQILDKVRKNPLVASSFGVYRASTSSERITMWLMRRGWFGVLKQYRRVVSAIKKVNHIV